MKLPGLFVGAALLMAPAAALAAPGLVTTSASLKAGPGAGFPVVDRIPAGARVNVHGCIRGATWCDVSWDGERGWVSARYLEYYFRNHYVYLPDYYEQADVPIVPFVLNTYWSNYYSGRPWYRRQAYWNDYWRSHARFATDVPGGRGGREVETRTRTTVTPGREGFAGGREMDSRSGRFGRGNETVGAVGRDVREDRRVGGREGRLEGDRFGGRQVERRGVEGRQGEGRQVEGRGFQGRGVEGRQVEGRGFEGRQGQGRQVEGRQSFQGRGPEGRSVEGRGFEGNRFGGTREGNRSPGTTTGQAMTPAGRPNAGGAGGAPAAHAQQPSQPLAARGQMGGGQAGGGARPMGGGGGGAAHAAPQAGAGGAPGGGGHPGGGPDRHH